MLRSFSRRRLVVIGSIIAAAFAAAALNIGASTPSTQSVAVPANAGQTVQLTWTGTIPAASAHPTSDCNGAGVANDDEGITVTIPRKGYDRIDATFTFRIAWTPSNPSGDAALNDEVLTVNSADQQDPADTQSSELGSSDGSTTEEIVVGHDLAPGTYHALACGYVNSTPQPYQGTLTVETTAKHGEDLARVGACAGAPVLVGRPGRPAARRGRAVDRDQP